MKEINLAYSTCPNDTFMFGAIANKFLELEKVKFNIQLHDIEELNKHALKGTYDITKISCAIYPEIKDEYIILKSGSALGYKNGPLLVSKKQVNSDSYKDINVAIPGTHTTANLLLKRLFPQITKKEELLFSDIEDAILHNHVEAGLLIHENRFTFKEKGLTKLEDLGEIWEEKFALPIPLGLIVAKREVAEKIEMTQLIKNSIKYAYNNFNKIEEYIKIHAQEIDESVIKKHIELYVNDFSIDLTKKGEEAINFLLQEKCEFI